MSTHDSIGRVALALGALGVLSPVFALTTSSNNNFVLMKPAAIFVLPVLGLLTIVGVLLENRIVIIDGGDPGAEVQAIRWPDDDAHLVVLCNMEGLADEVCDPSCRGPPRGTRITTTRSGCTPASATSPPMTSTKEEEKRSARPAKPASNKPDSGALPGTEQHEKIRPARTSSMLGN